MRPETFSLRSMVVSRRPLVGLEAGQDATPEAAKSVVIAGSVGFEQEDVAIGGSDICACG